MTDFTVPDEAWSGASGGFPGFDFIGREKVESEVEVAETCDGARVVVPLSYLI